MKSGARDSGATVAVAGPRWATTASGLARLDARSVAAMMAGSVALHAAALALLALLVYGIPVPRGNELVYLLPPYRAAFPDFLRNDWTYGGDGGWREYLAFSGLVGPLLRVASVEVVGWVGRIVCWVLSLAALLRLGRRLLLPLPVISVAIALWMAIGQAVVGGEWIIGTFEAKSIAYLLLLLSLERFLDGRDTFGAILLGLCACVHPAVGLVAGAATGVAVLASGRPAAAIARIAGWSLAFAAPGILPLLPTLTADPDGAREAWRFLALIRMPEHLDPLSFTRRDMALLALLFAFNCLHARSNGGDRTLRFLIVFQGALGAVFAAGVLVRLVGWFELLKVFPFRLFPLFVPLFFFFQLARAYRDRGRVPLGAPLVGVALLALMSLPNPLGGLLDQAYLRGDRGREMDDTALAFRWLAEHTPESSTAILPPWRKDSYYLARRAQVANWDAVRYDRVGEWRARVEAMVGPLRDASPAAVSPAAMEGRYAQLGEAEIDALGARYGADYLVSPADYRYSALFRSGRYTVYLIRRQGVTSKE